MISLGTPSVYAQLNQPWLLAAVDCTGAKSRQIMPTELCLSLLYLPVCAGIAGRFTRQQLSDLHKCAGTNGIAYITRDNQVSVAVGCNPSHHGQHKSVCRV